MRIDIGGGSLPLSLDTINLDPVHGEGGWKRYAQDVPWPVANNSVEYAKASHVLEHIPAGQPRIDVMNEVWRVLMPGGRFEVWVPVLVSPAGVNVQAIADPTHVSYWCATSFGYFDGGSLYNADYGIKQWRTLRIDSPRADWEVHWIGTPVGNDIPEPKPLLKSLEPRTRWWNNWRQND